MSLLVLRHVNNLAWLGATPTEKDVNVRCTCSMQNRKVSAAEWTEYNQKKKKTYFMGRKREKMSTYFELSIRALFGFLNSCVLYIYRNNNLENIRHAIGENIRNELSFGDYFVWVCVFCAVSARVCITYNFFIRFSFSFCIFSSCSLTTALYLAINTSKYRLRCMPTLNTVLFVGCFERLEKEIKESSFVKVMDWMESSCLVREWFFECCTLFVYVFSLVA